MLNGAYSRGVLWRWASVKPVEFVSASAKPGSPHYVQSTVWQAQVRVRLMLARVSEPYMLVVHTAV